MMMPKLIILLLFPVFLFAQQQDHYLVLEQPGPDRDLSIPAADSAFLALKEALGKATDKPSSARYLQQMGRICYHLGHYPQAMDYLLQSARLFRETGLRKDLAGNLIDIGTLYYYNRQPALARPHYNEAYTIYHSLGDNSGMALTNGRIGHLYEKQHRYDSAFYYQRQALGQYRQGNNRPGIAKIYENLGSIHEDLEQYDSARYYFKLALENGQDDIARIEVLNNLGDVARKTGHYEEGMAQTRAALELARKTNEQYQLCSAYRDIARTFNLMGNNDSAFYYLEISRGHLLDIYSEESGKQLALLQTMFDIEKKNHEIEGLQHTRRITGAIVVVGLLLVTVALLIISRQRLRIKNARLMHYKEKHQLEIEEQRLKQEKHQLEIEEQRLKEELETRSKELSTHTLSIIQKNQLLEELRLQLDDMVRDDRRDQKKQLKQLQLQINQRFNRDQHWDEFKGIFEQVHASFFDKLKSYCDGLTANDLRLVALLKMNLESADIATLLNISQDSLRVVRYRLRKKLNLQQGENLTAFIQSL